MMAETVEKCQGVVASHPRNSGISAAVYQGIHQVGEASH